MSVWVVKLLIKHLNREKQQANERTRKKWHKNNGWLTGNDLYIHAAQFENGESLFILFASNSDILMMLEIFFFFCHLSQIIFASLFSPWIQVFIHLTHFNFNAFWNEADEFLFCKISTHEKEKNKVWSVEECLMAVLKVSECVTNTKVYIRCALRKKRWMNHD